MLTTMAFDHSRSRWLGTDDLIAEPVTNGGVAGLRRVGAWGTPRRLQHAYLKSRDTVGNVPDEDHCKEELGASRVRVAAGPLQPTRG